MLRDANMLDTSCARQTFEQWHFVPDIHCFHITLETLRQGCMRCLELSTERTGLSRSICSTSVFRSSMD